MKNIVFFFALILFSLSSHAQLNVTLLHQLVENSKTEHGKQIDARDRQVVASANEEVNKTLMVRLKDTYRDIHSRFTTLSLAIDASQVGIEAYPIINDISQSQETIFRLCKDDPVLSILAIQAEMDMGNKAHSLLNFLYGIALSASDINQMKQSDRKMLFSHVLTELRQIVGASRGLAATLSYANRKKALEAVNPFSDFINTDKALVESILQRKGVLKN